MELAEINKRRRLAEQYEMMQPGAGAGALVAYCFAARTAMHFAHLQATNYAEHIALGDFYDEIASLADAFIECHMGVTGQMASYPQVLPEQNLAPIKFLSVLREQVVSSRAEASEGQTELENLIDEILSLIDRTCYKLKFLK